MTLGPIIMDRAPGWGSPSQPMVPHPHADIFPEMLQAQYAELLDDVRANGVREPVVMFEGKLLDGRHRYRAALDANVEYPRQDYLGDDPLGFVVSLNLKRRHLNEGQRAMVASRLAKLPKGRPGENTAIAAIPQASAAAMLNVSTDSIQRARAVQEHGTPALVASVDSGEVAVSAAAEVAKLPVEMQDEVVAEGPEAIREIAAELRAADLPRTNDAEMAAARAVVVKAAIQGIRGGAPRESRKNPLYQPSPHYTPLLNVVGACQTISARLKEHAALDLVAAFKSAAEREEFVTQVRAGRDALSQFLEVCDVA